MKIVHIGTADNRGGAARAAFQLHTGLLDAGHRSHMLVNQRFEDRPEIDRIGFPRTIPGRALNRAILEGERMTGMQNLLQPRRGAFLSHEFIRDADIIHLHNVHGNFFPHTMLPRMSRVAPIVWTLHDTWALTGHCAYNYDCDRWRSGCGECPRLAEYPPIAVDTTRLLWSVKRRTYEHTDVTVVAPSTWLARMASESPLFRGRTVAHIPYSVDTKSFLPLQKADARRELGLDPNVVVLMASVVSGGERKGPHFLAAAVDQMTNRPVTLLVIGGGALDAAPSCTIRAMGHVESRRHMNLCYAAADVFVLPTLADNLPVSVLEAFASGTPVAAFDVGGVPDLVVPHETGSLARLGDAGDLARAIDDLLSDSNRLSRMAATCRARAVSEFSPELQARRYIDVYEDVKERRARAV